MADLVQRQHVENPKELLGFYQRSWWQNNPDVFLSRRPADSASSSLHEAIRSQQAHLQAHLFDQPCYVVINSCVVVYAFPGWGFL